MIQQLLSNYGWLFGVSGAGVGVAFWFLGGASVLRIVASVIEVLSPIVKSLIEYFLLGLRDILDSLPTIVTVAALMYGVHIWDKIKTVPEHNKMVTRLEMCQSDLAKVKKQKRPDKQEPMWDMPFNLDKLRWPF